LNFSAAIIFLLCATADRPTNFGCQQVFALGAVFNYPTLYFTLCCPTVEPPIMLWEQGLAN